MSGAGAATTKPGRVARGRNGSAANRAVLPLDDLFRDGKDAGALRTIGEVAQALGLRQHVLRYWEDQFPMLRPLTRAGGRRYYRPEDIRLVVDIDRLLHREGYTIRGALQALVRPPTRRTAPGSTAGRAPGSVSVSASETPLLDTIDREPVSAGPPPAEALLSALAVLRQHLESIRRRLADALGSA